MLWTVGIILQIIIVYKFDDKKVTVTNLWNKGQLVDELIFYDNCR